MHISLSVDLIRGCCVRGKTHNSVHKAGDIVQVIGKPITDVMKELNGLRQMSHCVPDTHCTLHHLTQTHTQTFLYTLNTGCIVAVLYMFKLQFPPYRGFSSRSL